MILRPTNVLQRRFEEWAIVPHLRPFAEFVLMLKLHRRTLPW